MTSISSYGARVRPPNPLAADPEWVHRRFERAVDIIQSLPKSGPIQTNYDDKLLLYAVYKQATEGNIKSSRPGMFDVLGRAKWDAWNKRKGLSAMEAERMYVETLIRVFRGYSDRTQAVELMRELETFSLVRTPPRALAARGSKFASSRGGTNQTRSSSGSSSSSSSSSSPRSTASLDDHVRTRYSTSQRSRSNLTPQAAPRDRHRHHHHGGSNRVPPPPPADLVAPSLPGYGPPRTRTDSVKQPRRTAGRDVPDASDDAFSTSDSEDDDGATGPYASVPPTAPPSVAPRSAQPHRRLDAAPPSISARPPPPRLPPPSASSFRGNNSPAPSVYSLHPRSTHQQVAYPANFVAPLQPHPIAVATPSLTPLTSSNLLQQTTPPVQVAGPAPAAALDAALDRIQTSLTALHERLSILEATPGDGRRSSSLTGPGHRRQSMFPSSAVTARGGQTGSVSYWLRLVVAQLLVVLRVRSASSSHDDVSSSPPSSRVGGGLARIVTTLLPNLALAVLRRCQQVAGDVVFALFVVALLARVRGVDVVGVSGEWFARYLVARRTRNSLIGAPPPRRQTASSSGLS